TRLAKSGVAGRVAGSIARSVTDDQSHRWATATGNAAGLTDGGGLGACSEPITLSVSVLSSNGLMPTLTSHGDRGLPSVGCSVAAVGTSDGSSSADARLGLSACFRGQDFEERTETLAFAWVLDFSLGVAREVGLRGFATRPRGSGSYSGRRHLGSTGLRSP